eukprot:GFUD01036666.1.p1 GENE.GFUD01036666.1~~GFUD01036666.1.p1  ORF type:complete len:230 (-),score=73.69 GFUD01036666.1:71-760(-)
MASSHSPGTSLARHTQDYSPLTMAAQDDRGFKKTELVMFNPQAPNFQSGVNLVERDTCPNGYQLVNPDRSGKKTQYELVELAAHVQTADKFTRATAGSKLQVIAEQVRHLQETARKVLEEARLNALIHKTACNFTKIPGTTYYVYKNRKNPDTEFISMISPEEWGAAGPEFVGGYRLEFDQSWTALKDCDKRTNEMMMINQILETDAQVSFSFLPSQYQAGLAIEEQKP